jgi:hypothetical protein
MTHHAEFPPYLPRSKIDVEPHPVDASERPVLGLKVPGIEHHVLAVVQLILRQKTLLCGGLSHAYAGPGPSQAHPGESFDHFVGVGE